MGVLVKNKDKLLELLFSSQYINEPLNRLGKTIKFCYGFMYPYKLFKICIL